MIRREETKDLAKLDFLRKVQKESFLCVDGGIFLNGLNLSIGPMKTIRVGDANSLIMGTEPWQ